MTFEVVSEKTEEETSLREEIVQLNGALSTARTNIANVGVHLILMDTIVEEFHLFL